MGKQVRVLHVLGTTNLGGAESRIMDLYRHIDREKIQFDFLIHTTKEGFFDREIKQLGGNIYYLPSFRVYNYFAYKKACKAFFASHNEFQMVQGHMTSTASIYLPVAKKAGVPVTIAHARSAGVDKGLKGWITKFLRRNLHRKCDYMFSCSDLAASAVFGEKQYKEGKVVFVPNAVDTKDFAPDKHMREKIRREYGLENSFVIGHVGRFHYAKNHEFILDIFAEVLKQNKQAMLFLLGDGPRRQEMEEKAAELGIKERVIFAGNQNPVAPYYQAMDAFLFPSRFEGMPGTVVEAQAAGLPSLIADTITTQVKVTELVTFLSLAQDAELWAEQLNRIATERKMQKNTETEIDLSKTNYDVNYQVKQYEQFYLTGDVTVMKK